MKRRALLLVTAALTALLLSAGVTASYLADRTERLHNTFTPAEVTCQVTEQVENNEKAAIQVQNTGNIPAYLRLRLLSYRVNEDGQRIGGPADIPAFRLGEGWLLAGDGCWYYESPVEPMALTGNLLAEALPLRAYTDADGGRQVIEVVAEAVQATPEEAVEQAWSAVTVENGLLTAAREGGNGA